MNTPPLVPVGLQTPPTPRHGPKHDPPILRGGNLDTPERESVEAPPSTLRSARTKPKAPVAAALNIGLPTPAKTPQRKRKAATEAGSSSKLLFGAEIRSQPNTTSSTSLDPFGFSSGSKLGVKKKAPGTFLGEDAEFEIYTDPNMRTPELDDSKENPFLDHSDEDDPRQIRRAREKRREAEARFEALGGNRDDGLVMSFRGKKFFKKFDEDNPRQKMKGALLFPSARQVRERDQRAAERATQRAAEPSPLNAPPKLSFKKKEGVKFASPSIADSARITKSTSTPRNTKSADPTPDHLKSPSRITRSVKHAVLSPGIPDIPRTPRVAATPRTPQRSPPRPNIKKGIKRSREEDVSEGPSHNLRSPLPKRTKA